MDNRHGSVEFLYPIAKRMGVPNDMFPAAVRFRCRSRNNANVVVRCDQFAGQIEAKKSRSRVMPLIVVSVTGAALVYGTLDMPFYGDPHAPIQEYPKPSYIEKAEAEIHVPNVITAVLASYRGYDTLP